MLMNVCRCIKIISSIQSSDEVSVLRPVPFDECEPQTRQIISIFQRGQCPFVPRQPSSASSGQPSNEEA